MIWSRSEIPAPPGAGLTDRRALVLAPPGPSSGAGPALGPRWVALPRLSELGVVVLTGVGWAGADIGWAPTQSRVTLVLVGLLLLVAAARQVPVAALAAGFLLCSHLGARASAGYVPLDAAPLGGEVSVLTDPERFGAGTRIELRLPSGDRVEATGYGRAAADLSRASIGETLTVEGRIRPVGDRGWLRTRHITGLATIERAEVVGGPGPVHRVPEFFRRRIAAGASTMAGDRQSLYLGLVIGDDRAQSLGQRLRFRASGLTHLLAVSGQNVAFVLAVARPLLQVFGYRGRLAGLLLVLAIFALITRLEPSVLRATATASIAAWATMSGRERSGLKVLGVAVVALLCLDPFLVDSVGFQLSVAASTGILVLQPAIEGRLPGPGWLVGPLATTLSAQVGVSPLLAFYFGPISLASIPANLLAGWAAAMIMTIGLTVGVAAGMLPAAVAEVAQAPAEALLWWIEAVATRHARLPAPRIGPVEAAALAMLLGAIRSRAAPTAFRAGAALLAVAVLVAAVPRATAATACGPGIAWYPAGGDAPSTMVLTADAGDRSVESCHSSGIRSVDLLIVARGSASSARLVAGLRELMAIEAVVAPPQHRVIGARRQLEELRVPTSFGGLVVAPSADGRRLDVEMNPPAAPLLAEP